MNAKRRFAHYFNLEHRIALPGSTSRVPATFNDPIPFRLVDGERAPYAVVAADADALVDDLLTMDGDGAIRLDEWPAARAFIAQVRPTDPADGGDPQ